MVAARAAAKSDAPYKQENKLFLGNLGWDTDEDGLKEYFAKFGTVLETMVLREKETNKSRGFGFVTIDEDDAVEKVLNAEHTLDGRQLNVRRATKKQEHNNNNCMMGGCGMGGCGGMGGPMMCGGMPRNDARWLLPYDAGRLWYGRWRIPMMGGCGGMGGMGGGMGCGPGGMQHSGANLPAPPPDGITERKVFVGGVDTQMRRISCVEGLAANGYGNVLDIQMMNKPESTPGGRGLRVCDVPRL